MIKNEPGQLFAQDKHYPIIHKFFSDIVVEVESVVLQVSDFAQLNALSSALSTCLDIYICGKLSREGSTSISLALGRL